MSRAEQYNIDTYKLELNDPQRAAFPNHAVRVGKPAPSFSLPTVDGDQVSLQGLSERGHVVLIFGCFTAPPAMAQLGPLEVLHRTYGGRGFSFLFVYTREVHPGEGFPPHRSLEQKANQARRMRDHARISFPVAVDDLDGTVHNAFGGMPSFAIVIHRDGTVIARSTWTQWEQIQMILENLLRREKGEADGELGRLSHVEWISYMGRESDEYWALLDQAGPKAREDYDRENARERPRYR
jgi:hypothetical protein